MQFSLRTFLVVTCAVGVGVGVLGHLFMRNPNLFAQVASLVVSVGPFLLAIGTILWLGSRRTWSGLTPVCGACKGSLPVVAVDRAGDCPKCGASLREPKGILFLAGRGRRWGLFVWGLALVAMPLVGIGLLLAAYAMLGSQPGLRMLSNQQLIKEQLPNQVDQPWVWRELEQRLKTGSLSQADVDETIKELVKFMTTSRPQGWDRPLTWQRTFLESAVGAGKVSDPVLFSLCDAYHGMKPRVEQLPRLREGTARFDIEVRYGSVWASHGGPGLQLLWQVDRVLMDGQPISIRQTSKNGQGWSGRYEGDLKAGEHEITVELDCAYVDEATLKGLNADELSKSRWPKARKRWQQTVSAPLKVYPAKERLVGLTTDARRDPGPGGGIVIERLAVLDGDGGKKRIVLRAGFSPAVSGALSYDVAVSIGGRVIPMGSMWTWRKEGNSRSSGGHFEKRVEGVDPAVRTADVILTPNPSHIEKCPDVSEIWGGETVLRGEVLERLDSEGDGDSRGK